MALIDVAISCLNSIREIEEDVKDAIVYIDAGCTESFQLAGAFPLFLELGARSVCSLENMTSLDAVADWSSKFDCANRIVIMTSRLLNDAHRYMLRCLSTHEGVSRCTVFTSISEGSHSACPDSPLGPDAYREYETLLVQDYNEHTKKSDKISKDKGVPKFSSALESLTMEPITSENVGDSSGDAEGLVVSVHHFPLIICPFTPRAFVLPSQGSVAEASLSRQHEDSLSFGLPPISTGSMSDTDDVPPGATLTAHFLYQLALKMELKLEIFSLGDVSKNVGKIMTDMSSLYDVGRRKRTAGLLLVDRTLDLITPCCHGDSLFDRIFSSLPRGERFSTQAQLKQGVPSIDRPSLDVLFYTSQGLAAQISDLINKSALAELQAKKNEKQDSSSRGLLSFRDALLLTVVGYILAGENFLTAGFSWQEEHFRCCSRESFCWESQVSKWVDRRA